MPDEATLQREDTMLYRAPTADSDDNAVTEIWGRKLETRVVDASEVPALLKDGWVEHPQHIARAAKPEEGAGFEPVAGKELTAVKDALAAAEKLVEEQGKEIAALTTERDDGRDTLAKLTAERDALVAAGETLTAEKAKLAEDLAAAEALTGEETKAKDAALAELAALKAAKSAAGSGKGADKP